MSMSKRLQIVLDEQELSLFRRRARKQGLSLSEWARAALRRAAATDRGASPEHRLRAIERALQCNHPTANIDDMLAEIERGRGLR